MLRTTVVKFKQVFYYFFWQTLFPRIAVCVRVLITKTALSTLTQQIEETNTNPSRPQKNIGKEIEAKSEKNGKRLPPPPRTLFINYPHVWFFLLANIFFTTGSEKKSHCQCSDKKR